MRKTSLGCKVKNKVWLLKKRFDEIGYNFVEWMKITHQKITGSRPQGMRGKIDPLFKNLHVLLLVVNGAENSHVDNFF
jgi:hypothetical protein